MYLFPFNNFLKKDVINFSVDDYILSDHKKFWTKTNTMILNLDTSNSRWVYNYFIYLYTGFMT